MILNKLKNTILVSILLIFGCHETAKISEFDYTEEEKEQYQPKEEDEYEETKYFDENQIYYSDHRYSSNIKSDQLFRTGFPLSSPIIELNSSNTLTLSFDQLGNDVEDLYYKIIHCDARWNPTDILENQYTVGFFSDIVRDYDFSFGTFRPYVHYELEFPNSNMRPKISGNYILLVIRDNEMEQPILSKRFMVFENRVSIVPRVKRPNSVKERKYHQAVDFEIHHFSFNIENPYRDLDVVMRQNERWDNAKYDLKPIYIKDRRLIYEAQNKFTFEGGNEFRFFNLRSVRYQTDQVERIEQKDDGFYAWLKPYGKRSFNVYTTNFDINGRYEIKTTDANDSDVESEYVSVNFSLPMEEPVLDANIYVAGGFSNRQAKKENQMIYDDIAEKYKVEILLKQGYYDYQYVVIKDGDNAVNSSMLEGTHFDTENDYDILVYYKDITDDYQRLIGVNTFNSRDY